MSTLTADDLSAIGRVIQNHQCAVLESRAEAIRERMADGASELAAELRVTLGTLERYQARIRALAQARDADLAR